MNRTFALLLFLIMLPLAAKAQWIPVGKPLAAFNTSDFRGGGIFYEHGRIWVCSRNAGGLTKIVMSTDMGNSWQNIPIPFPLTMSIADITFCSQLDGGYSNLAGSHGVITNDGTVSWKNLNNFGASRFLMMAPNRFITPDAISFDSGKTWKNFNTSNNDLFFGIGRNNKGDAYSSIWNGFYVTHDSGVTWIKYNPPLNYTIWSISGYSSCYDSVIYGANEKTTTNLTHDQRCNLYVSRDGGKTFQSYYNAQNPIDNLTGTVHACKRGVAYASTYNGVIMSTDFGVTWTNIGGPPGLFEGSSFDLVDDHTLVAVDSNAEVWITTNANDHDLPKPVYHPPIIQGFTLPIISSCDSGKGIVTLQHSFCSPLFIVSAVPLGTTSPEFTVSSISLPDTIDQTKTFTVPVSFNPSTAVGNFSGGVHIIGFYLDEGDTVKIDTAILFSASSKPVPPNLYAPQSSFTFDTVSTCGYPVDTIITLINKGCDTLTITDTSAIKTLEFSILQPFTLPIKIPPDSSIIVKFQFMPSGTGTFTTSPKFHALQQGLGQDIILSLEGFGKSEGGVLTYSPKQFNFQSLSICSHDSASGFVTNVGCASVALDPTKIFGDPDYILTANSSQIGVKPLDTVKYEIYLNPAQKGLRTGYIIFASNTSRDSIPLSVTVTNGTRILSASVQAVDFGTISVCDSRDTTITINNTGCDTVFITGLGNLGLGFGTNTLLPDTILPGQSKQIQIFTLLDTAGGKMSTFATITFQGLFDNTINPINLIRTFSIGAHRDLGLFLDPKPKNGGDKSTVLFDIKEIPGKSFTGAGIQQIGFDLKYNTDLLTFDQTQSTNITSTNGQNFTIPGSPNIQADANGILASIGFTVFLTKDSTTTINLLNAKIDTTNNPPCGNTTFSYSGSTLFDYNFVCGERSISGYMNGVMPMKIISLRPNPAQDGIELNVQSFSKQDAVFEIYDALGTRVFSNVKNLQQGASNIRLDTKTLSSGVYLVRLRTMNGETSQSFMKVH